MKILIVEDSPPVRLSLKKLLSGLSHIEIVGEAETLLAAFELIEAAKPEVVILDIVLKDGSGFELLKKAKDQERCPLVIVLTNYASPPFRKKAEEDGADYFFDKSTEFDKVVEVLRQ